MTEVLKDKIPSAPVDKDDATESAVSLDSSSEEEP